MFSLSISLSLARSLSLSLFLSLSLSLCLLVFNELSTCRPRQRERPFHLQTHARPPAFRIQVLSLDLICKHL